MRVRLQPKQTGDQRAREGTKSDRRDDQARRGARYVVLVAVAFVVALGVGYLARKAVSASHQSSQTAKLTGSLAGLTKTNTQLVARVAALAKANDKLVKRVEMDERQTCLIQARGLPAGHQLAATMEGIYALLTLPPASKAQKLAAKNTPPSVRAGVLELDKHLAAYLKAEAKQPKTRHCS